MQKNANSNKNRHKLAALVFSLLLLLAYACDPTPTEVCEEIDDICTEKDIVVQFCSESSEEYFIVNNDTISCEAVGNCDNATEAAVHSCTTASLQEELEIKQRLNNIMMRIRLQAN